MPNAKKLCFVCTGNIVRSPLAEHLFRHFTKQAGLDQKYQVASAGTIEYHVGQPPDERMRRVAARHGLIYTGKARRFHPEDFEKYDLILALDRENLLDLQEMAPDTQAKAKIHMLREFDPLGGARFSVPDPYYEGMEGFEEAYQIIERSVKGLIEKLEDEQGGGKDEG